VIVNGKSLLKFTPLDPMESEKIRFQGTSYGLSEAGYDLRIKQDITFVKSAYGDHVIVKDPDQEESETFFGSFCLASTIERFAMPNFLVATIKDKSTWARQALSVFNTVVEPGWHGWLTLELVYHGQNNLHIPAGSGIAQALFSSLSDMSSYGEGKYQNAGNFPQPAVKI
jgi:dCTP deaminase